MPNNGPIAIKNDNNATIVFSLFLKNKDIRYLNAIKDYINNQKYKYINMTIGDINDLFYQVDGKSIIEFIMENKDCFNYDVLKYMANNVPTLKECIRLGYNNIVDYITSEDTLLLEYDSGKTVFDFLLENDLLTPGVLGIISEYKESIERIQKKNDNLLKYLSNTILTNTKIGDITILEYLFQKNMVDENIISEITDDMVYDLCIKYQREDLLEHLSTFVLKEDRNGKTILELLLDNNIYPKMSFIDNKKIIKVLIDRKLFNYFVDESESNLLIEVEDGVTVLDILLDNGITPNIIFYFKKESLKILINHNRFDLVETFSLEELVGLYNLNETYLDIMLKQKENGFNINLSKLDIKSSDNHSKAMFYIIVARHGFIKHVESLSESTLLNNNGELLKELLEIDKDLTLNTILSDSVKQNIDVAFLLKSLGIEQKDIKIDLKSMDIVNDYYNSFNSEFSNREINDEGRRLIEEFRSLMLSDNLSDREMIEAMIASYTYLISTSNEYGIRELMKLIEIKKNNKDFVIRKSYDGSFYRNADMSINLENTCLNTLNHETGHALFHLLTDEKIPDEFEKILYNIRSNPNTLKKVSEYSKKYREIRDKVSLLVDEKYMKDYQIDESDKESIEKFVNRKKEELIKSYIEKGYDEETVDTIVNGIYSIEEYIKQDRRIKREELIDAVLRSEYGSFVTISDIIDSIYIGKFRSGELINKDGNIIPPCPGHGIAYYSKGVNWLFDELMANFSAVIKSPDAREILSYLKGIVGEEFVSFIEDYYRNQISLSTKDLSTKEEKAL